MPNDKPPKTDWSFIDDKNKKPEKSKTDWSFIDGKGGKEKLKEVGEKGKNTNRIIASMKTDTSGKLESIRQHEYEQAKKAAEKFIHEHPTPDLEERLKHADEELRKKFGIE
jgi:hypothetical protein